ncbi:MAG: hypothetical protein RL062_1351, partial [Bacteroidota bacterium]
QENLMVNGGVDFGTLHLSQLPKGMYEVVVNNLEQQSVYQTRIVLE